MGDLDSLSYAEERGPDVWCAAIDPEVANSFATSWRRGVGQGAALTGALLSVLALVVAALTRLRRYARIGAETARPAIASRRGRSGNRRG